MIDDFSMTSRRAFYFVHVTGKTHYLTELWMRNNWFHTFIVIKVILPLSLNDDKQPMCSFPLFVNSFLLVVSLSHPIVWCPFLPSLSPIMPEFMISSLFRHFQNIIICPPPEQSDNGPGFLKFEFNHSSPGGMNELYHFPRGV